MLRLVVDFIGYLNVDEYKATMFEWIKHGLIYIWFVYWLCWLIIDEILYVYVTMCMYLIEYLYVICWNVYMWIIY
jgi:hypothetical protein